MGGVRCKDGQVFQSGRRETGAPSEGHQAAVRPEKKKRGVRPAYSQ